MLRFRPKLWVKKVAVHGGVLRAAARFAKPCAVVLMYHSIVENPDDTAKTIRISNPRASFEAQMSTLGLRFNPVSIEQVIEFAATGRRLPARSVAVTFDDGFADNYEVALPILSRYSIPVTFYILVNAVETGTAPWYIRLNFAFTTTTAPTWRHPGNGRSFDLSRADEKNAALNVAWDWGAARTGVAQEQFIRQTEDSLRVEPLSIRLMMNWEQVRALKKAGHIVGGHTLSHPNLAHVPEDEARSEIRGCKERLEEKLAEPIQHFSYPHPALNPQWNQQTLQMTREAGFKSAMLTTPGQVRAGDEPLSLKRTPGAKDFDEWLWRLERAFL
ncbi:MAG: polysaccharide deacetylase family protein [Terriglobales bacterium]